MEQLIRLIDDYQHHVEYALALLKRNAPHFSHYGTDETRRGTLVDDKRNVDFYFHGRGCCFSFSDGPEVDIDYASERYDLIDVWFLKKYWESVQNDYPQINSEDHIDKGITELLRTGFLTADPESHVTVYCTSQLADPKVFSWE